MKAHRICSRLVVMMCLNLTGCAALTTISDTNPCHDESESGQIPAGRQFIFNQSHQDNAPWWWIAGNAADTRWRPQSVPVNSCIRIQLPAGPAQWKLIRWTLDKNDLDISQIDHELYESTGSFLESCRNAGIAELNCPDHMHQYQFVVRQTGQMRIGLRVKPPLKFPVELAEQQNGFRYFQLTLNVTSVE
ncbi:MAG: hypothetical protein K0U68_07320 [Gammaproteobacteria bacterium]|nr:hypothetical protein [Gammaproteobacteria bacterium]